MKRLLSTLIACLTLTSVQAATVAEVATELEQALGAAVDVLAPNNFAAAQRAYEAAAREQERGRSGERIERRLDEAQAALQRARTHATFAQQAYERVIRSREDALAAEAPKYEAEAWRRANERFLAAMAAHEEGDAKDAQRRAAEADVLLREIELAAIKRSVLDETKALIAQAEEADVHRGAPRSFDAARRLLAQAEEEIQRNRYELVAARRLTAQAAYEARHATHLAALARQVREQEGDDQAGVEALVLGVEGPLQQLATSLEATVRFDQGFAPPLEELSRRAREQADEIRGLRLEVADREEQIVMLRRQTEQLEARLGGVSQERIALQRRVDEQEQLRQNVAQLGARFSPDEALVERRGDDVVISLLGLSFAPGRSALTSKGETLLNKAKAAIELFPDAALAVEGHTDAQGADNANLLLSQDRADAVRRYLMQHLKVDAARISAVGYGEARPVATNETAQGRARNRRIELIIRL